MQKARTAEQEEEEEQPAPAQRAVTFAVGGERTRDFGQLPGPNPKWD